MRIKKLLPVVALFSLGFATTGCNISFGIGTPPGGDSSGVPPVTTLPPITVPPVTTVVPTTSVPPTNSGGGFFDWFGDGDDGILDGLFRR